MWVQTKCPRIVDIQGKWPRRTQSRPLDHNKTTATATENILGATCISDAFIGVLISGSVLLLATSLGLCHQKGKFWYTILYHNPTASIKQ